MVVFNNHLIGKVFSLLDSKYMLNSAHKSSEILCFSLQ